MHGKLQFNKVSQSSLIFQKNFQLLSEINMYCLHMVHFVTHSNSDANTKNFAHNKNKQIQRIYVPAKNFLRNKESSENVKFIGGATLTRYILSTYVDSNNAWKITKFSLQKKC